jgi:hypothetical protein
MKNCRFYLLLVGVLFAGSIANAQLKNIYSGQKLPVEEGWQELKLDKTVTVSPSSAGTVSQTVGSGALKLTSTNVLPNDPTDFWAKWEYTQLGWYKTGLGLSPEAGYTIEIKAKAIDASKHGAFNIQWYDIDGNGYRLGIYNNSLVESTNPLAPSNVLMNGVDNATAFHTYRFEVTTKTIGDDVPRAYVDIYRDGSKLVGDYRLALFQFDNIIENGGFEDGNPSDLYDSNFFPDFRTDAKVYRTKDIAEVKTGNAALILDNDGISGLNGTWAKSRDLAVKPDADYFLSFARKRIEGMEDYWAWRDAGAFYDTQNGTLNGSDDRDKGNILFTSGY